MIISCVSLGASALVGVNADEATTHALFVLALRIDGKGDVALAAGAAAMGAMTAEDDAGPTVAPSTPSVVETAEGSSAGDDGNLGTAYEAMAKEVTRPKNIPRYFEGARGSMVRRREVFDVMIIEEWIRLQCYCLLQAMIQIPNSNRRLAAALRHWRWMLVQLTQRLRRYSLKNITRHFWREPLVRWFC